VAGSCERDNGPSVSIKVTGFLDQLRVCQFLKQKCVSLK
jgi:hypothetical protein